MLCKYSKSRAFNSLPTLVVALCPWERHSVIAVINASAAVTLLEQRPEKKCQALSEIRTHDLCDASAVLSQLSYQSHMRAVVYGLALYMRTFRLGPGTVKMKVICPIVATE